MKRKAVIAIMVVVVIALSAVGVYALNSSTQVGAASVTARFFVAQSDEAGNEFSMVSENAEHVIYINDGTAVYFEDYVPLGDEDEGLTKNAREVLFGRTLAEVLEGRNLRVTLAGNQATSVTILFETAVTLPQDIDPEDGYLGIVTLPGEIDDDGYIGIVPPIGELAQWDELDPPVLNGEVVVNNEILKDAPLPFWYETENGGVVMVPLNVVAQALGYDVSFNDELQSIQLGVAIHLWIGNTEAHLGRMAPIELSAAPLLVDDEVFAPLDFFRNVLGQTAYVFEGQVVIETYSDMS